MSALVGAVSRLEPHDDSAPASGSARLDRDDLLARLQAGIAQLTSSTEWLRWLAVQAKFWRYSPQNCLLIAWQRPDVSAVAGFHRWRALGRHVRKGETGIRILAPCRYRTTIEDDDGDDIVIERLHGFRVTTVFGLEQTDGQPLPEMPISRVEGGDPADRFDSLRDFAHELGYRVTASDFASPHKCGETDFATRTITLRSDLTPAHRIKTTLHELGHIIAGHDSCGFGERSVAELEAESLPGCAARRWGSRPTVTPLRTARPGAAEASRRSRRSGHPRSGSRRPPRRSSMVWASPRWGPRRRYSSHNGRSHPAQALAGRADVDAAPVAHTSMLPRRGMVPVRGARGAHIEQCIGHRP